MATAYENGIFGMIPAKDWLDVGTKVTRQGDPIDSLFGDLKTDNLVAEYDSIAADRQIPIMSQFHGFDTESLESFREPFDIHSIEKGLIKAKIPQSEKLRELMNRKGVRESELYDWVVRDGARLADEVITRTKAAKNELMATGKVTIKENHLDLTIDYGVPEENTSFEIDPDGDVASQIEQIVNYASANGVAINGILTSKQVLSKIRKSESMQKAINGVNGVGAIVKSSDFEDYLLSEYGIATIITNDLMYRVPDGTDSNGDPKTKKCRYYPSDKITFFSADTDGKMGIGLWGDPPEATTNVDTNISGSEVSPYVTITQWAENDPKVTWTKASALFVPVLYSPDSLYIATIKNNDRTAQTVSTAKS